MSRLCAIDPGKDMLGLSFWDDGVLREAAWYPIDEAPARGVEEIVLERPRARRPEDTPGGVAGYQALIDIAVAGAHYAGFLSTVRQGGEAAETRFYYPDEWKGSTKKPKRVDEPYVVELRCRKILTPDELARVVLPSARGKHHNVWDAIGLGLFALGRCGRGVTRR